MPQSRRSLLKQVVVGSAASLAVGLSGCLSNDNGGNETNDTPEPGGVSIPNPVMASVTTPEPEIHTTDHTVVSDSEDEYTAGVMNAAAGGDILTEFYWVDEDTESNGTANDRPSDDELMLAGQKRVRFGEEEYQEVVFTGTEPDGYNGFWFFVGPITVTVTVKNRGGAGDVVVSLYDGETVTDETTISMEADEEREVELESDAVVSEIEFDVEARPANA